MAEVSYVNLRLCRIKCDSEKEAIVVSDVLRKHLTFTYKKFDLAPGRTRALQARIEYEDRSLYQFDEASGSFLFMAGFFTDVCRLLKAAGLKVNAIKPKVKELRADFDRVRSKFEFRPGQEECLNRINASYGGVIDAVPAFGKAWVISMVCQLYPEAKIDVVTASRDVADMLYDVIRTHERDVGRVNKDKERRRRVTIYTAGSLHKSDCDADIVLMDEVHELVTPARINLLARYLNARMFGFSATTETRSDNAHVYMFGLCGPRIFHLRYKEAQDLGLVVPINVIWVPVKDGPRRRPDGFVTKKRVLLWTNPIRNAKIAEAAKMCYENGLQTLVVVDTVEHVLHLHRLLPEFQVCYSPGGLSGKQAAKFRRQGLLGPHNTMTPFKREQLRKDFESRRAMGVIANTVWATGVSFNQLEVLVRADGGSSETRSIQTPGRVCRISPTTDKEVGIVFDFSDQFDDWAWKRAKQRFSVYKKMGWGQYDVSGNQISRLTRDVGF